ncbi:Uncharacterised protein [Staphylococcus aureus]|nr:Uncharacterised protein [Staphylococcus aureus]
MIVNDLCPKRLASTNTARLSAVSPDCEIKINNGFSDNKGILYTNSDATCTSVGTPAHFSMNSLPTKPAW